MVSANGSPIESLAPATGRARACLSQECVRVDSAVVAVAPHEVDGIAPDRLDLGNLDFSRFEERAAQHCETESTGHGLLAPLVITKSARALLAEHIEAEHALMSVLPPNVHFPLRTTDTDLFGICRYRMHGTPDVFAANAA
jgi:hypothetical protein